MHRAQSIAQLVNGLKNRLIRDVDGVVSQLVGETSSFEKGLKTFFVRTVYRVDLCPKRGAMVSGLLARTTAGFFFGYREIHELTFVQREIQIVGVGEDTFSKCYDTRGTGTNDFDELLFFVLAPSMQSLFFDHAVSRATHLVLDQLIEQSQRQTGRGCQCVRHRT